MPTSAGLECIAVLRSAHGQRIQATAKVQHQAQEGNADVIPQLPCKAKRPHELAEVVLVASCISQLVPAESPLSKAGMEVKPMQRRSRYRIHQRCVWKG